jgi:hypothetical protein
MSEIAEQAKAAFAGPPIRIQDHETPIVAPAPTRNFEGAYVALRGFA